ncbi:TonB-dependent receptor [Aestuariicella sp. G3-2]|uniref:TonB-dependent receptor n=1 Tax=Pseudomaricurvus albidus TaxID=2842452 RepID=UPI001C0AB132|nr:TonB-dependent receptor [Aestuariicella albida]MBU3069197.1 TonB-dependent receptor [Aestuariicella albida]
MNYKFVNTPKAVLSAAIVGLVSSGGVCAAPSVLEEIIVTAQKRDQSLQDVPLSVSVLSEEMISTYSLQSVEDLKTIVPALNIFSAASPAQSSISIRGAGTGASDPTLEPSVGIFVDDIFMPRSIFGLSDLLDIEQVEVLLGPQGTLYGKNTNSGVVSLRTRRPTDEFEGWLEMSLGDYGLQDTKASVSGPIIEGLKYRISARNHRRDGVMENEATGSDLNQIDKQAYRGQLLWDGADNYSVLATAYYSLADSRANSGDGFTDPDGAYGQVLSGAIFPSISSPLNLNSDDRRVYQNDMTDSRVEVSGGSLVISYDLADVELKSVTGYQQWEQVSERDSGQSLLDILNLSNEVEESSFSQELRLTSTGGEALDWVAGVFYFNNDLTRGSLSADRPYATIGDGYAGTLLGRLFIPGSKAFWQSDFSGESISAFGQGTYSLTENLDLTAGLRYSEEKKDFTVDTRVEGGGLLGALFGADAQSNSLDEESVTGMVSLSYRLDDGLMTYATIATGEKSGGFNAAFNNTPPESREYASEKTTNYEVGIKASSLLDGRARLNLAYFYTEYKDFQATTFNDETSSFLTGNAGRQVTQGVDLDAALALSDGLTLTARLQYLDARYRDYKDANCHPEAKAPHGPSGCDVSDKRMTFAPNWAGSIALDYTQYWAGGEFYGHVDVSFKTKYAADAIFAPYAEDESYEMLNMKLGWRTDEWDVSFWGKNITDETYGVTYNPTVVDSLTATAANAINGVLGSPVLPANAGNSHFRWLNDPATYGVTVRYTY